MERMTDDLLNTPQHDMSTPCSTQTENLERIAPLEFLELSPVSQRIESSDITELEPFSKSMQTEEPQSSPGSTPNFLTTYETVVSTEVEPRNVGNSIQPVADEEGRLVPEITGIRNEVSENEAGNPPEILLGILQQLQGKEARKVADQLHDTIMKGTSWYKEHNPSTASESRQVPLEQVEVDEEIELDSETDSVRLESRQNSEHEQNQGTSSKEERENFPRSNKLTAQERARYRKQLRKQKLAQERKQKNQPTLTGKLLKLMVSLLVVGAEPYLECLSCALNWAL